MTNKQKTFRIHYVENGVNWSMCVHAHTPEQARERFNELFKTPVIIRKVKRIKT